MGEPQPDIKDGIEYWATQPASYDGVLGGFGNGSLPRVDALGSRQFLLHLLPALCTVPSAIRPLLPPAPPDTTTKRREPTRVRALDVGAGVGRVTSDVLLPLVDDVVLAEPVEPFVREALSRAQASAAGSVRPDASHAPWPGLRKRTKSVTVVRGTLQALDPAHPAQGVDADGKGCAVLGRVGWSPQADEGAVRGEEDDMDSGFDVIWCQWCLGHLRDDDLIAFFRRCRAALRRQRRSTASPGAGDSVIVVKENLCADGDDGSPRTSFDETDSSLTRSDAAWKKTFKRAGLTLIHEQVQRGFPEGLYEVKMYALL